MWKWKMDLTSFFFQGILIKKEKDDKILFAISPIDHFPLLHFNPYITHCFGTRDNPRWTADVTIFIVPVFRFKMQVLF